MNVFRLDAIRDGETPETLGIFVSPEAAATFARDEARFRLTNVVFLFPSKANDPEQMEWQELEPGYFWCNTALMNYSIQMYELKGLVVG